MRPIAVLVLAALVLAAAPAGATRSRAKKPSGEITVSAAASLTGALAAIGERYEARHPKTTIRFNFGSSAALVNQIRSGAPADVFAAADRATMDDLVDGGQVTVTPTPFARNEMAIAVKPGNSEKVRSVADLAGLGTIALCGATAPCGVYATKVLKKAGVEIPESAVTRGADAKATVAAVAHGDAEAALVYVTDVEAAASDVTGVPIPDDENVDAVYPIAPLAESGNRRLARSFVAFVDSPAGRRVLARYGFLPA